MVAAGVGGGRQLLRGMNSGSGPDKTLPAARTAFDEPAEMLAAVRPLLARAGITRLANITGLDRIGIPVVVGARPNARVLSQSAGKGITLELAEVIGGDGRHRAFHAEVAQPDSVTQSYAELAREHAMLDLDRLPLSRHSLFSPSNAEEWTFGWDLIQSQRWACRSIASCCPVRTANPSACFRFKARRTVSPPDASWSRHWLSDCSKSSSATPWRLERRRRMVRYTRPTSGPGDCRRLSTDPGAAREIRKRRSESAGVRLHLRHSHPGVPDAAVRPRERRVGLAEGGGAHLDPELALVRSLTEAAQARAVAIAGARDDRFEPDLVRIRLTDSRPRIEALESQACQRAICASAPPPPRRPFLRTSRASSIAWCTPASSKRLCST